MRRAWVGALLVLGMLFLVTAACSQGAYPVDFFPEMHYSQAQRAQEPVRLLPPEGSVPQQGAELSYTSDQYRELVNPVPVTEAGLERGATLYQVNCSMCHGSQAKGDGTVGDFLVANGYGRPPNLTASPTTERTDGEIFGIITNGIFVMPRFKNLLSEEERWLVINHLRTLHQP